MKLLKHNEEFSLTDYGFFANQPNKGVWTFYKHPDFFERRYLKVTGRNEETGENIDVVPSMNMTIVSSLDQSITKISCIMEFPSPGVWNLKVYIDDQRIGNLNISVQ